jgi:hypothetical protein
MERNSELDSSSEKKIPERLNTNNQNTSQEEHEKIMMSEYLKDVSLASESQSIKILDQTKSQSKFKIYNEENGGIQLRESGVNMFD